MYVNEVYDLTSECSQGLLGHEDWAAAVAVVANGVLSDQNPAWNGQVRVIVPVSDEPPDGGDENEPVGSEPCNSHRDVVECTVLAARASSVNVFPVAGEFDQGYLHVDDIRTLMDILADGTGGERYETTWPDWTDQIALSIYDVVLDAAVERTDCNGNGIPDVWDLGEYGDSYDCHGNGIPDECDCVEDLDRNGEVDIDDVFQVLGVWGPCEGCCADFDHNDAVDIDDLFHVLGAWGTCPDTGSGTPPQGVIDCILQYASDPEDLATCIEAMQIIGAGQ